MTPALPGYPPMTLGTMMIPADRTVAAIHRAIALGWRAFDTAPIYGNEAETGAALRDAPVPREQLFVTTKLWNTNHGHDAALAAFDRTMARLGLDVLDLYLIHWPVPVHDRYAQTWRALVRLQAEGRVRAIGVSNFLPEHLERIIGETGVTPAVNQIELNPLMQQAELRAYHAAHGIATQAWSPLGHGGTLAHPAITAIATHHGRSSAQVILNWLIRIGAHPVVKSGSEPHMAENLSAGDFTLTEPDLTGIATLDTSTSCFGLDPRSFVSVPGMEDFQC